MALSAGVSVVVGETNTFVCLISERSLHRAEMRGRSKFLLFSRRDRMSNMPSVSRCVSTSAHVLLEDMGETWGRGARGLLAEVEETG